MPRPESEASDIELIPYRTYYGNPTMGADLKVVSASAASCSEVPSIVLGSHFGTMSSNPDSRVPSRLSTPNPPSSRFTAQAITAEDLLKSQTVGLVHLSDFRKRRVEALEQKEREAQGSAFGRFTPGTSSGAVAPSDG